MNEIDSAAHDELRTLRERAYGPAADIDQDPAAVQRLSELESRLAEPRAERKPQPERKPEPEPAAPLTPAERPADATPARAPAASPAEPAAAGAESPPRSPDVGQAASAPHSTRARKVLWALSVAAAAGVAAAITFSLMHITTISASGDATQIASLEPSATVQVPTGFMGAGPSARTFEFFGYTIFEATGAFAYAPSQGSDCFAVIASTQVPEEYDAQQGWSFDSPVYSACRAGGFPAVAQFIVDSAAPEETRTRFADGAALRFVFDGERVGVFLDQE